MEKTSAIILGGYGSLQVGMELGFLITLIHDVILDLNGQTLQVDSGGLVDVDQDSHLRWWIQNRS